MPEPAPMPAITNIEALRRLAMKRCPRVMFDYVDSGSYDEVTRDANRSELAAIRLPPARADRHHRAQHGGRDARPDPGAAGRHRADRPHRPRLWRRRDPRRARR